MKTLTFILSFFTLTMISSAGGNSLKTEDVSVCSEPELVCYDYYDYWGYYLYTDCYWEYYE